MNLECIATSLSDAIAIESNGGDRIELVSCLERGGFTPSDGLVRAVLDAVRIPVAVMLRPEQDSFHYSKNQLFVMRRDALRFQELGVRRIVTGILDEDGIAVYYKHCHPEILIFTSERRCDLAKRLILSRHRV